MQISGIESIKLIHESAHTKVFKGIRLSDKIQVAIKVLKSEFPSIKNITRFNEEFEITKEIEIKGVRKALDKTRIDNKHAILLHYVVGKNLKDLKHKQETSINDFLKIGISICEIIYQIHEANIIHKDINPKNILITDSGDLILIDFGLSTIIKQTEKKPQAPEVMEGTLAYMSPEQSGRMNRSVDYRTDLYSLGVTFYELLTQCLPFEGDNPMSIIYGHIAKTPIPPNKIDQTIPEVISNIVMKLLEKNAEDRYQSALAVHSDLKRCQEAFSSKGAISLFPIALNDRAGQFRIPEKLYGRENEISILLSTYQNICNGNKQFMLVNGYSGIGKTSLVNEVHKPMTQNQGYFISGKYDQYNRDVPYSAVVHALKDLVSQLLLEPEERISYWKKSLIKNVSSNIQIIIDLVPDLELITGKQEDVIQLGSVETQNRFYLVFQKFLRTICNKDHPLIMFIDDLQWADNGSLNLLKSLVSDSENSYFFLIGAYRDNEVHPSHPLSLVINELKEKGVSMNNLTLEPLKLSEVNQLVSDTLNAPLKDTRLLAELIHNKTEGNPFFVNRFFETLYEKKLISYNEKKLIWSWSIQEINQEQVTDNVVELMASKIEMLDINTQSVLKKASCIGHEFDLKTLSKLQNTGIQGVMFMLWEAVTKGLIIPLNENYQAIGMDNDVSVYFKFIHDRIHQATHSLISEKERKEINLKIARQILEQQQNSLSEDKILSLTNYYNVAIELLVNEKEKITVAQLNIKAGKKAKNATAYSSAVKYFSTALDLFGDNNWVNFYDATLDTYLNLGETQYLLGAFKTSDQILDQAFQHSKSKYDKAKVYIIKIPQLAGQGLYKEAVQIAIKALDMFELNIPDFNDAEAILQATEKEAILYNQNMDSRNIEDLFELPLMKDQKMIICSEIIGMVQDSLANGNPEFLPYFAYKIVNISVKHGLSQYIPNSYLFFIIILNLNKKYEEGKKFLELSLRLFEEKLHNPIYQSKIAFMHALFAVIKEPILKVTELYFEAYKVGLEVGDFLYTSHSLAVNPRLIYPYSLNKALKELIKAEIFFIKINNHPMLILTRMEMGYTKLLINGKPSDHLFDHEDFKESEFIEQVVNTPFINAVYQRNKLQALFLLDRIEDTVTLIKERDDWISIAGGADLNYLADFHLYSGVASAILYYQKKKENREFLNYLDQSIEELKLMANVCEINFYHIQLILEAEREKINGDIPKAMDLYDLAILNSQKNNYIKDEALANELAAKFYIDINKNKIANLYLTNAHYLYDLWGAKHKVKLLENKYPYLKEEKVSGLDETLTADALFFSDDSISTSFTSNSLTLDFQEIMKSSQLISEEIKLDKLLVRIMDEVNSITNADKGFLILPSDKKHFLKAAFYDKQKESELMHSDIYDTDEITHSLIEYCRKSLKPIVINSESEKNEIYKDANLLAKEYYSILCAPIISQGELIAIIYLENNKDSNAFNTEQLLSLNTLYSQIAISIDNALLYQDLELKIKDRTQKLTQQKDEIIQLKNSELASSVKLLTKKNELVMQFKNDFNVFTDEIKNQKVKTELEQFISKYLNNHLKAEDNWENFKSYFESRNENFFRRLVNKHPNLNQEDHKLCAYLYTNLSTKDIASIMNLEVRTIEKRRSRLIQKLELKGEDKNKLINYIKSF